MAGRASQQIARTVDEQDGLRRLVATLRKDLVGRPITLGWTHGDFYPGNVLADTAGVSGIISWSRARAAHVVALDLVFWLVTMPRRASSHGSGCTRSLRG